MVSALAVPAESAVARAQAEVRALAVPTLEFPDPWLLPRLCPLLRPMHRRRSTCQHRRPRGSPRWFQHLPAGPGLRSRPCRLHLQRWHRPCPRFRLFPAWSCPFPRALWRH